MTKCCTVVTDRDYRDDVQQLRNDVHLLEVKGELTKVRKTLKLDRHGRRKKSLSIDSPVAASVTTTTAPDPTQSLSMSCLASITPASPTKKAPIDTSNEVRE